MDESQSPVPQSAAPARDHLKRKVDKLVDRARWTMWWEGAWPLLWVPIAIILVFLTVSWLGIWLDTPPLARARRTRLFCRGARPLALARPAPWPAVPLAGPRPGRPRHRPQAWPRPHPRRQARPGRCRPGKPCPLGSSPQTRRSGDREVQSVGPAARHAEARPLRPARRGHAGRRRERLRRRPGSRLAACRRLRLEAGEGGCALLPGRRLGRPAALYPRSAADDRPCRRAAEAARPGQVDGGRPRRGPGRSRDHARCGASRRCRCPRASAPTCASSASPSRTMPS